MEIKLNIKKLDDTYVLIKRRNKQDYFYRGAGRRATPRSNYAVTFSTFEEARMTCLNANQGKHRPFFKVKKAGEHFASRWNMTYSEYSTSPEVQVQNSLIAISKDTIKQQNTKESLKRQKEDVLDRIKRAINDRILRIEQTKQDLLFKQNSLQEQKDLLDKVVAFDYEGIVEANKSESEKIAELLYAKS